MAGKVDSVDLEYFEQQIQPHIDGIQIEFLGEANHQQKSILMGGAAATLFPITWKEPFGLVMIESMVTGTPVIAMSLGSAPEVIAHGVSGFLCNNVDECIAAIAPATRLSRYACRDHVLVNFTAKRMADGYEAAYQRILAPDYLAPDYLAKDYDFIKNESTRHELNKLENGRKNERDRQLIAN
jgi:glycosyltransferase involved in cell wall biosynthesis